MIRPSARALAITVALVTFALAALPAFAQSPAAPGASTDQPAADKPPTPFSPEWAQLAGWEVFTQKGCGKCHSVRGVGGKVGPDLGRIKGTSFFAVGADLWNHVPKMGARMREARVERPRLTAREAGNLIAFLFTAQYADESGDAGNGQKLFTAKGCVTCHAVGGAGGGVGPALDRMKRANSPVSVAAAMWNHGPRMAAAMKDKSITRPTLEGKDLLDIVAYLRSASKDTGETEQVLPGTPDRGRNLFTAKKCAACHAVGGRGGRVGPDLGTPGHHMSLTEFATRMWNHAPAMAARMKERGIEQPKLSGQDIADVLAYLYVSRYFEPTPSAERGRALAQDKGCLGCHSVRGTGGGTRATIAADFSRSQLVRTPQGLVAGMWNHSLLMERAAQQRNAAWPTLTGEELADLSAYLASVSAPGGRKPAPRPRSKTEPTKPETK